MTDNISYTVAICTLGCKVNQYESEAIAEEFEKNGFLIKDFEESCDIYVINTCTVTAESARKSRQMIRRAISHNKKARIMVTGCHSQVFPESISAMQGVDYICGNRNKLSVVEAAKKLVCKEKRECEAAGLLPTVNIQSSFVANENELSESMSHSAFEKMSVSKFGRVRAYIKIEDGCERRCAYCIIPSARGRVCSKLPEDVIKETRMLTASGCPEIVLTGIETGSYGKDLDNTSLSDLLKMIEGLEGLERIRLGSLDPTVITEKFVNDIKDLPHIAPHFHLSLQSGSARTLAAMKRRYSPQRALESIERLRSAFDDVMFTTDIITGFPGESENDFQETLEFIERARFLHIHIFPYSQRKGTLAASMSNQVPMNIRRERAARLASVQEKIVSSLLSAQIGKTYPVLFETDDGIYLHGHTPSFIEVKVKKQPLLEGRDLIGTILPARLISFEKEVCFAEPII